MCVASRSLHYVSVTFCADQNWKYFSDLNLVGVFKLSEKLLLGEIIRDKMCENYSQIVKGRITRSIMNKIFKIKDGNRVI